MPENTASQEGTQQAERTFTQDEVNRIVADRLARHKVEPPADYEELKAKAAEYDKGQEAQKSELQKALERAERAEKGLEDMRAARKRDEEVAQAARDTGVPLDVLEGYGGDDVAAYAEGIKGYFAPDASPHLGNDGRHGNATVTRDSILSIADPAKRKAAIAQHIELFEGK